MVCFPVALPAFMLPPPNLTHQPSTQAIIDSPSSPPAYIPYSARPEYSDVVPIPQQDAEKPLVPIMYSEECEWWEKGEGEVAACSDGIPWVCRFVPPCLVSTLHRVSFYFQPPLLPP
jgi:hypothetical protein